ncbi:hypothetical protein [Streptomyces brasiliensis]|uniref:Uncharacterized protein n=1 Tax=Streptomyces brasiliensis TaxID=1954 RepID=A0A917P691_9ACTN|nr:hypothetical protein [Streptomyces brasiliensis]GGJ63604.1 hypothetical protein GCM10010121_087730 [Streptomyces brasiliensis]
MIRKEACLKGLGTGLAHGLSADYLGTGPDPAGALPGWTVADVPVGALRTAAIAVRLR